MFDQLGTGGSGSVYKAQHKATNIILAIKRMTEPVFEETGFVALLFFSCLVFFVLSLTNVNNEQQPMT